MVSFWLVDPPGVSYFSVHCSGLDEGDSPSYIAELICAEGALVLIRVGFHSFARLGCDYFVYRAGPGNPSLELLPDRNAPGFGPGHFGLLPACGGSDHYAVAFLTWKADGEGWRFDANVFSSESETQAWTTKPTLLSLSDSDKLLLDNHDTGKQITVGADSLGWVDMLRGILLLTNLFHDCPVIQYIPLPEPKDFVTDEDGDIFYAADRDVTCSCNGLIKLVEVESYNDHRGWIATTCTRMVSWDGWRHHIELEIAGVSVDPSYRALLPELWDDKTKRLDLKKRVFFAPTLSMGDDDFVYMMMTKVNEEDDERGWVITLDMKREAVEALAPFSPQGRPHLAAVYCPCAFPKYLNMPTAHRSALLLPFFPKYSPMLCLAILAFCWCLFRLFTGLFEDCRS